MTSDVQSYIRASQSYHSVLASIKVRLISGEKTVPKSHSGLLSSLYHEFVEDETLRTKSARALHIASEVKRLVDPGDSTSQVTPLQ